MPKPRARRATETPSTAHAEDSQRRSVDILAGQQVDQPRLPFSGMDEGVSFRDAPAVAISSVKAKSAVVSVSTPGVLVTRMPRAVAAGTSILS